MLISVNMCCHPEVNIEMLLKKKTLTHTLEQGFLPGVVY